MERLCYKRRLILGEALDSFSEYQQGLSTISKMNTYSTKQFRSLMHRWGPTLQRLTQAMALPI